jgi:tRNA1(Val) A37 N6-methylase TrmN6
VPGTGDQSQLNSAQVQKQERVFTQNILFSDGIPFYPDDTVEDLQRDGLRLLQKQNRFRFGTDSVLLAAYVAALYGAARNRRLLAADLGAGCGAVSVLLSARLPNARIIGMEADPESYGTFERNIALNHLQGQIFARLIDLRLLTEQPWPFLDLQPHSLDLVVGNPPYLRPEQSLPAGRQRQAREETELPLDGFLAAAASLLKPRGRLVVIHKAHRLPDVLTGLRSQALEPRTLRLVQPLPDRPPAVFLVSATYQGKPGGFRIEPPLLIEESPGCMGEETAAWYGREQPLLDVDLFRDLVRISGC